MNLIVKTCHTKLFDVSKTLAFAAVIFSLIACTTEQDKPLPNIVFFLVDDLGWRDVGCYGSSFYETPNIDALAKEGVRFTDAYAACHVCSPTRASILTGRYPARLQLTDWLPGRGEFPFQKLMNASIHQELPSNEITLAEALKAHGYSTAIFGKWHLGEEPNGPLAQGFDVQIPKWNKGWPKTGYHAPFELEGIDDKPGQYLTDRLTDEAMGFIEVNKDKPFFLYLSHFTVHDPIEGRQDLVEKYKKIRDQKPSQQSPPFILEGNPDAESPLSKEELETLIQQEPYKDHKALPNQTVKVKQHQDNVEFAGMVESMDESLGRVISKLNELGITDNTIIIFFSDNGGMSAANFGWPDRVVPNSKLDAAYSTSNLPLRGAKGWLYEGGIRVPLIIKWPGQGNHGMVCDVPVISTDFFPTLLDMAGLPLQPEQHNDGVSLVPLLNGENQLEREAIYWHFPHYSNHGMQSPGGAIRFGDYKLLEYYENYTMQLFNLREDLEEQNDLTHSQPEKAAELRKMLHAWRKEIAAQMMPPNPEYKP
jgi:arylsulfatase A-like enzyme